MPEFKKGQDQKDRKHDIQDEVNFPADLAYPVPFWKKQSLQVIGL